MEALVFEVSQKLAFMAMSLGVLQKNTLGFCFFVRGSG